MKPSDFQKTVQCRFESCLKKVVRHVVKDYQKKLKRRQKEETLFCEFPEIVVENLAVWDEYETDYTIFNVCGNDIRVYDDELAEALKKLPERKRNNVLMYYLTKHTKPIIPLETGTKAIEPVPGGMRGSGPPNGSARASERSATGSRRIVRAVWPRCGPKTGTPARPASQRCDEAGMPGLSAMTWRRCAAGSRSRNWRTR